MNTEIPIDQRALLSVEEAAAYFHIGRNKLREMTNSPDCKYVLWSGHKRLIKRKLFEAFLEGEYSV